MNDSPELADVPEEEPRHVSHWPGDWPGRAGINLDNLGDPGSWLDLELESDEELIYGDPVDDVQVAANLTDAYISASKDLSFPMLSDSGFTKEQERETLEDSFVAFIRAWRTRSFDEDERLPDQPIQALTHRGCFRVSYPTIATAFDRHGRHIASDRNWSLDHHAGLWLSADTAFSDDQFADFEFVYDQMQSHWKIFRNGADRKSASDVFAILKGLPSEFRTLKLSELRYADASRLLSLLVAMKPVKTLKSTAPSFMAISKFLHFWNPHLFVILDVEVMLNFVFGHKWLWAGVAEKRRRLAAVLPRGTRADKDFGGKLGDYLAVLFWSADVMRQNPSILRGYAGYLSSAISAVRKPQRFAGYEAVAIEWFLLGLTQTPPEGVET